MNQISFFVNRARSSALRMLRTAIAALAFTATAACNTIYISTLDGEPPRVERSFGLIVIQTPDKVDAATVMVSHGFGAARTPTGFTVGFWKEQSAIFGDPSACRTVIWVEDKRELSAIRRSLSDTGRSLNSLCIINGDTP